MHDSWEKRLVEQLAICKKHHMDWVPSPMELKIAMADNALTNMIPINGVRYPSENGMTGWFIWSGEEFSESDDFFKPHCVGHLPELNPLIIPFLGLPPGYRFLIDGKGYVDVWEDPILLLP